MMIIGLAPVPDLRVAVNWELLLEMGKDESAREAPLDQVFSLAGVLQNQ